MILRQPIHFWDRIIVASKTLEVLVRGVGPIAAVLWIGWQYEQSRIDKRVEATLEYAKLFQSDSTAAGKAQRALSYALRRYEEEIKELSVANGNSEQLGEIRATLSTKSYKQPMKKQKTRR